MRQPITARAILLLALLAAGACPARNDGSPAKPPGRAAGAASAGGADAPATSAQVVLMPPGRDPITVKVEIADDEAERTRGLMFREQLAPDAGMLFLFERPAQLAFWMRNTYLPLDMIFIEPTMTILGVVENAEPRTDDSRFVTGHSQYVLEVNAGFSRQHGLTPGTMVQFVGVGGASTGR
jgi:uncharacterized protein